MSRERQILAAITVMIAAIIFYRSLAPPCFKARLLIKEGVIDFNVEMKKSSNQDKYFNPFDLEPEEREDPNLLTPEEEVTQEMREELKANERARNNQTNNNSNR